MSYSRLNEIEKAAMTMLSCMRASTNLSSLILSSLPYIILMKYNDFKPNHEHDLYSYSQQDANQESERILALRNLDAKVITTNILEIFTKPEFKLIERHIKEQRHLLIVISNSWMLTPAFQKILDQDTSNRILSVRIMDLKSYHSEALEKILNGRIFPHQVPMKASTFLLGFSQLSFSSTKKILQLSQLADSILDLNPFFTFFQHLESQLRMLSENTQACLPHASPHPDLETGMLISPSSVTLNSTQLEIFNIIFKDVSESIVPKQLILNELVNIQDGRIHLIILADQDNQKIIKNFFFMKDDSLSLKNRFEIFSNLAIDHEIGLKFPCIKNLFLNKLDKITLYFTKFFLWRLNFDTLDDLMITLNNLDKEQYDFIPYDKESNFKKILEGGQFDDHLKTIAFFSLYHNNLKEFFQRDMNPVIRNGISFDTIKPDSLRQRLKRTLNKGGYSFMQILISLGIEVEFANVPYMYKKLLQSSMNTIQLGWNHPGDESVECFGKHDYSGESTTPPIRYNRELTHTMINILFLQAMKAKANRSCGLHIHIGVKNLIIPDCMQGVTQDEFYHLEYMKQFLQIYLREKMQWESIERGYSMYAQETPAIQSKFKEAKSIDEFLECTHKHYEDVCGNKVQDRYVEINFLAFKKHGTIEIRRFAGTTEEAYIYSILSCVNAMAIEAQLNTNTIIYNKLPVTSVFNPKYVSWVIDDNERIYLGSEEESSQQLFFAKKNTEQKMELCMLRVNKLLEYDLHVVSDVNAINENATSLYQLGRIYISLDEKDRVIQYKTINRAGTTQKTGSIDDITPFPSSLSLLSEKDKNTILIRIAQQGHAKVSHLVKRVQNTGIITEMLEKSSLRERARKTSMDFYGSEFKHRGTKKRKPEGQSLIDIPVTLKQSRLLESVGPLEPLALLPEPSAIPSALLSFSIYGSSRVDGSMKEELENSSFSHAGISLPSSRLTSDFQ
jgi:hypothetical protein